MTTDVAVVGGGIAGLAAAYELGLRGVKVRVLEAADHPGGVIRTDRFDGWVVDGGPDSLLVQKPAAVALCRELGLGDRLVPTLTPRTAYVLRRSVLYPIPEGSFLGFPVRAGALARSSLFTIGGRLRMACEPFVPRRTIQAADDESIASFVRRRFGAEAVDYLAEPLLAGIHAGDVDRLSIRSLFPRLVEAERVSGSVLRAFRGLATARSPQGAFVSLPGGVGELVDAVAGALAPGTIALSSPVVTLRRAGAFTVATSAGTVQARAVIMAAPAYAAADIVRAGYPALAGLCDAMPYASTATVAFGYRRDRIDHPLLGSGFVVPRAEGSALLAATWVTSKWPHRAPEGHVLLRAFLGGGRDPHRLDGSDDELMRTARQALAAVMPIRGEPVFTRLYRWTRGSPQFEVGHTRRLANIDACLRDVPGLYVTGSGFRSIGIPDCIADARETAARAAAYVAGVPSSP